MDAYTIILGLFIAINVAAFFVMANDKRKSIQGSNSDRTPEGFLFFLASAFGAVGVFAGMQVFRHKTKKWYFQLGIPLLILENLATVYVLIEFLDIN